MKKAFLYVVLAIVMFCASFGISYMIITQDDSEKAVPVIVAPTQTATEVEEIPIDDKVRITISAVGDCTLGTDESYGFNGTLGAELVANKGDYSYFLSKVKPLFEKDDITIVNLEGPISDRGAKASKQYTFRGPSTYTNILSTSSVEAANLSNNHSMDYGKEAYADTMSLLSDCGISAFGGDDISIIEVKGIKVGLIGVNALEAGQRINFAKNMDRLKEQSPDIIVASFHWGEESAAVANADQIALAHNAVDLGADLVIGHHPHVLQGIEKYNGKYIVYSLANFCFGGNRNPADRDTMIFTQTFTFKDNVLIDEENVSVIPCYVSSIKERNNFQPIPVTGKEAKRIANKIVGRSADYTGVENVGFICEQ